MTPCPHCAKPFKSARILDLHVKHMHSGEVVPSPAIERRTSARPTCPVCGAKFMDKASLKRHESAHYRKPGGYYLEGQRAYLDVLRSHPQTPELTAYIERREGLI